MPRPLKAPPPSGVFYPPGLFSRLALQTPGRPFAHVAQPMQVHAHGLDSSAMPGRARQIVGQQSGGPHRTRHPDGARIQVDHPLQFAQPARRHLERAGWCACVAPARPDPRAGNAAGLSRPGRVHGALTRRSRPAFVLRRPAARCASWCARWVCTPARTARPPPRVSFDPTATLRVSPVTSRPVSGREGTMPDRSTHSTELAGSI
jgi:hypothetical protein